MTSMATVVGRLKVDPEFELGVLRIMIIAMALIYLAFSVSRGGVTAGSMAWLGLALALAFLLLGWIVIRPGPNPLRLVLGMIMDSGLTTLAIYFTGEAGESIIGASLILILGYGFRFGRPYLFACQALCIAGFGVVLLSAPYWKLHLATGWGLLVIFIIVPLYVSVLLERVRARSFNAEQALRTLWKKNTATVKAVDLRLPALGRKQTQVGATYRP